MDRWRHDPGHRRGVAYRDPHTRERYRQIDRRAVDSRRDFRGFEGVRPVDTRKPGVQAPRPGTQVTKPAPPTGKAARPDSVTGRVAQPGAIGGAGPRPGTQVTKPSTQAAKPGTPTGKAAKPDAAVSRPATERAPGGLSDRSAIERGKSPQVFQGIGKGNEVRRQSNWGQNSRNASKARVAPRAAPSVQPKGTGVAPKVQAAPKGGASAQPRGAGGAGGAAPGGRR